jgi:F-type H+-transporting ATPase subunit alpha
MSTASQIIASLQQEIDRLAAPAKARQVGTVTEVGDGIARLSGLDECLASELLEFPNGAMGVALNLEEHAVGAVILGASSAIKEGDEVRSTGKVLSIPVGAGMVGRVVDALGRPVDGKGPIKMDKEMPVEKIAPRVIMRQPVHQPMMTGIKAIDAMIPIGRGQRELIIGDRQTGKTSIAVDAIINQKGTGVICVYVAIGQKESKVAQIVGKLEEAGAMGHTIVVVSGASDAAALSYIAPYAGTAIAEYFMEKGGDALIVYDDLSKHAWAYREISLLLRRPPGREAYPGDVFYLHSRLLERSAKMAAEHGGGSLTALPIIETQAGDVSAYIPTNVISITDGQIYLESDLFYKGIRPAVNAGLSVSRVGSAAQTKAMKKVSGKLRLDLSQFRELEAFAQFATDLDEGTRKQIDRGRRAVELLKQPQYAPLPMQHQVAVLYALVNGLVDDVPADEIRAWEDGFHAYLWNSRRDLMDKLGAEKAITDDIEPALKDAIAEYKLTRKA